MNVNQFNPPFSNYFFFPIYFWVRVFLSAGLVWRKPDVSQQKDLFFILIPSSEETKTVLLPVQTEKL
jgi:hypothetical protein